MIDETLLQEIRERAHETEFDRRLPADIASRIAQAGWFRSLAPRAYGGGELHPSDAARLFETVAEADAAAAWCVMISATSTLSLAYLPEAEAREVAGRPDSVMCGVYAPMGRATRENGVYRVSGVWPWASNSPNSDWMMGGCVVTVNGEIERLPNGQPDPRMIIFSADQVTLNDTWHAAGLKGTGSGEMEVNDAEVPVARSLSLVRDRPRIDSPLYAFPVFGMLALGIASVALGNARAAIHDLIALASAKKPQASARRLAEHANTQAEVAKSDAALRSARAMLYEAIDAAWKEAQSGAAISLEARARIRLSATHATRTAADVTTAMYQLAGGSSVFLTSPLQRRFRDAHVATQHMMVAPSTYELAGRVLLGLETDASFL